jgi:hypothetical protein
MCGLPVRAPGRSVGHWPPCELLPDLSVTCGAGGASGHQIGQVECGRPDPGAAPVDERGPVPVRHDIAVVDIAVQQGRDQPGQQRGCCRRGGGLADECPGPCDGFPRMAGGALAELWIDPVPAQRLPPRGGHPRNRVGQAGTAVVARMQCREAVDHIRGQRFAPGQRRAGGQRCDQPAGARRHQLGYGGCSGAHGLRSPQPGDLVAGCFLADQFQRLATARQVQRDLLDPAGHVAARQRAHGTADHGGARPDLPYPGQHVRGDNAVAHRRYLRTV